MKWLDILRMDVKALQLDYTLAATERPIQRFTTTARKNENDLHQQFLSKEYATFCARSLGHRSEKYMSAIRSTAFVINEGAKVRPIKQCIPSHHKRLHICKQHKHMAS